MKPGYILNILLQIIFSAIMFPQSGLYSFKNLTIDDGLTDNVVNCVFQDQKGFVWFGTNSGIDRFDGYSVKNYRNVIGDNSSLSHNQVFCVTEDKDGYLWAGTYNGLNRIDKRTGKEERYFNVINDSTSLPYSTISDLFVDKNGNLWVTSFFGFAKYLFPQNRFKNFYAGGTMYSLKTYNYIENLKKQSHFLTGITKVGNNRKLKKSFSLYTSTRILVYTISEIVDNFSFDKGWIEDAKGKVVWTIENKKTYYAGGHSKNSVLLDFISLHKGNYNLYFQTDDSHSYNEWNSTAPDHPEDWGIQLFSVSKDDEQFLLNELKNSYTVNGLPHHSVYQVAEDRKGNLVLATARGISIFSIGKETFRNFLISPEFNSRQNKVNSVYVDKTGKIWCATDAGVFLFNPTDNSFKEILKIHSSNNPNEFIECRWLTGDDDENIWVTTGGNQIVIINSFNFKTEFIENNVEKNVSLRNLFSGRIFKDKAGSVWITNWQQGVLVYHSKSKKFKTFIPNQPGGKNFSNNSVTAIAVDDKIVWAGTSGNGLYKHQINSNSFINYKIVAGNANIADNKIYAVFPGRDKKIWVGTETGLYLFNGAGGFKKILFKNSPINMGKIKSIKEDKNGNLLVATNDILISFNPISNSTEYYKVKPPQTFVFLNLNIDDILIDKNDDVWVSTWEGVGKLNKETKEIEIFKDQFKVAEENHYWTLFEDHNGQIWAGSQSGGLKKFDKRTKTFISFRTEDGLPSNNIRSIMEDDEGNLWLGTERGMTKFNRNTFYNFSMNDGLPGNQFNPDAVWKTADREIYFGTNGGMFSFYPGAFLQNKYVPPVAITSFKIFNKELANNFDIAFADEITLEYFQNSFTLQIAALNYIDSKSNQYKYKIEDFDDDWTLLGTKREITYTNLSPGKYLLEVQASNNDGVWNEKGIELGIIILPPWYRTWWAYMFYIFAVVGLYISARKFELNKIKMKNELKLKHLEAEKLKETDKIKSNFFANISHEFRTPLTLIIEPVENLLRNVKDGKTKKILEIIERNSKRLLDLINQLLDLSKLESGGMQLKVVKADFIPFFKGIVMSFESLAAVKKINLELKCPYDFLEIYFDPDKTEKIITNLIANAFKFSNEGGIVSVELEAGDEFIRYAVADKGMGIAEENLHKIFDRFYQVDNNFTKEGEGSGIGLALTKELVTVHKGIITVESELGKGSKFTVRIPVSKTFYSTDEISEAAMPQIHSVLLPEIEIDKSFENEINKNKQTILLVEDNIDMRNYIRGILIENFQVIECLNGEEGLTTARELIPDLILSDVMMPKMDGKELCANIKNDELTSHIPVILLTAKAGEESIIEGLETGADDYILKPFSTRELLVRIKNQIKVRATIRQKIIDSFSIQPVATEKITGLSKPDKTFIEKVTKIVEMNFKNPEFNIEEFSRGIGMSASQLRRKMNALFGKAPNEFIRTFRLNKAAKLITEEGLNISDAAFGSGFNSLSYFSKCFLEEFGKNPSYLMKK